MLLKEHYSLRSVGMYFLQSAVILSREMCQTECVPQSSHIDRDATELIQTFRLSVKTGSLAVRATGSRLQRIGWPFYRDDYILSWILAGAKEFVHFCEIIP